MNYAALAIMRKDDELVVLRAENERLRKALVEAGEYIHHYDNEFWVCTKNCPKCAIESALAQEKQ